MPRLSALTASRRHSFSVVSCQPVRYVRPARSRTPSFRTFQNFWGSGETAGMIRSEAEWEDTMLGKLSVAAARLVNLQGFVCRSG
jgi:hypothetical protein